MRIQPAVVSLSVAVVALLIVATFLGYGYLSAEGQLSSLKSSGRVYCSEVNSVIPKVINTFANVTDSLQAQIHADNSIVASLNASKPAGYQGIVTTLEGQMTQDLAIIAQINSYTSLSGLSNPDIFCYLVSRS